ncbi:M67 family metallopeptidase [Altererythrobacter arenosus]|uniref:M67 family metallopeptidase n=1 Tax=Altererythrobacter arenosus TaxID=3032592 RepID=A0ABY8FVW7_9SPHN|nr:M67 family metallopeptidase [Altererythrobacter sp. CAU 1644]WFL78108.1 M67 family metallopeptidase [Altererythrobacter sp. CAU 1644]
MQIEVTRDVIAQLKAAARQAHPHECCGILYGEGRQITHAQPARNVHPTPDTHFEIDPQALIDVHRAARAGGPQVLGYYHSHPESAPHPSRTDQEMATGDRRIWAIIGMNEVMFWLDDPAGFQALSYEIVAA